MSIFRHSGYNGDIVYALRCVKEFAEAHLLIDYKTEYKGKNALGRDRAEQLADLVETQGIKTTVVGRYDEEGYDLDLFRKNKNICSDHLVLSHWKVISEKSRIDHSTRWFHIDPIKKEKIIINRSLRRHNSNFNWNVLKNYKNKCLFVGFKDEYEDFCDRFFYIKHYQCKSMIELARVISGSSLFIGNQSFSFALAESMKKPRIQEVYERCPNCVPSGKNWSTKIEDINKMIG